jgi:Domain of unknown function (DUF4157)
MRGRERERSSEESFAVDQKLARAPKAAPRTPHPSRALDSILGNQQVQRLLGKGAIQAKLKVSQPGEAEELEADRIADEITSVHAGTESAPSASLFGSADSAPRIQRKCQCSGGATGPECEGEDVEAAKGIHRKAAPSAGPGSGGPSCAENAVNGLGSGRAMESGVRKSMESRFGHDFSSVRIHDDAKAASAADSISARAFTYGTDIAFGQGEYAPQTPSGLRLLTHELVHVLQQERSAVGVQRQPVGAASSTDQEDYVRQTIRFLEESAEHYRQVAKVEPALFDRVIDSWYSMVIKQGQLIDTDLHGNAALKANLRTAYISALRILITKHATTSVQTEEDLYFINSGRIPPWALPHPTHLVAGMTTPIPDEVTVTQRRGGRVQFSLNGFDVTVSPDIRVRSQATQGRTRWHIEWGGVGWRARRTRAGTTVVSVSVPPTPVVTLFTSYVRGANTAGTSAYGRGTTREDQAGARITPASGSLAFHESRHSQLLLDFLRNNAPPTFTGKVGDTLVDFKAAETQWKADVMDYVNRLEQADTEQVHCVGFTIDDFNAAQAPRGRRIAKECP